MVEDQHREIIREALHHGIIDLSKEQVVNQDGYEVRVTPLGEGCTRFDLPRLKKTYIMMSGRLYQRPYLSGVPDVGSSPASSGTDPDKPLETHFASQPGYNGEDERVDIRIYKNKIICACGNPRYIKSSDRHQSRQCKPCTLKGRQERRKAKQ